MLKSMLRTLLLLFACTVAGVSPAAADVFRSGEFAMTAGEEPNSYEFTARVPQALEGNEMPVFPEDCTLASSDRQAAGAIAQYAYLIECPRALRTADVIETPWPVDGATFTTNVMGQQVQRSLPGTADGVTIPVGETSAPVRPFADVATDYLWQGIIHIWMGWDHLAFVLCLCLLTSGRRLLWLVTAFTLGHSISLALAFFEVVSIPIPPVEAIIALSIAFMAREALQLSRGASAIDGMGRYLTVVSLFGLLHGLGFASALGELGVAPHERVTGLIFFNLGVETGQLAFVAVVTGAMAALRGTAVLQPARATALYGVGILGAFWAVERVAGFTVLAA